jgi:hypothetical protein
MDIVASNSTPERVIMRNFDFQGTSTSTLADVDGNTIALLNSPPQVSEMIRWPATVRTATTRLLLIIL